MQIVKLRFFVLQVIAHLLIFQMSFAGNAVQDDPVKVKPVQTPPTIDGDPGDACWLDVKWQPISQVWIPFGGTVPADDFTGRYKMVWSETENVIYFIVEIVDNVFVDGYTYPATDYPNYDLVEVCIDEDKSGGLHVFDGTGDVGVQWGTNAENAFSYHIMATAPANGETTTNGVVCDIAGTSWSTIRNYASHLKQFAMKKNGTTYHWEFSLAVYNDSYSNENPEASRVQLSPNKILGLSMAYCDNDDPAETPKTRDNFFGSVAVTAETYNDHWKQADGFGSALLMNSYDSWANNYPTLAGTKTDDDDGDGVDNFTEFALRGNPTNSNDKGFVEAGVSGNWFNYIYARRKDGTASYIVETATNLVTGTWTTNGIEVLGEGGIDTDYEAVTNRLDITGKYRQFIRLRISE